MVGLRHGDCSGSDRPSGCRRSFGCGHDGAEPEGGEHAKENILITGANRGIGLELVRQYAVEGWRVYATCRRPEAAATLAELARARPEVSIHRLDVTRSDDLRALAAELAGAPLDVLYNTAPRCPGDVPGGSDKEQFSSRCQGRQEKQKAVRNPLLSWRAWRLGERLFSGPRAGPGSCARG